MQVLTCFVVMMSASHVFEIVPDRAYCDLAVGHGGGHAPRRAVAYVTGREDAGQAGLQLQRFAILRPRGDADGLAVHMPAGEDVALVVALDDLVEPRCLRPGPDQHERRGGD